LFACLTKDNELQMGNGPKTSGDAAKASPTRVLSAELGDDSDEPVSYCEMSRTLTFQAVPSSKPSAGAAITLRLGVTLTVWDQAGTYVGDVVDREASAIGECVRDGYRMVGNIRSFDDVSRRGELIVSGVR